ncbi:MAG TPA: hypothetical protein VFN11_04410 [Ktedonobacterales bacterium]|nr:hypothetical protein [Ktedonobacterales bacterium]
MSELAPGSSVRHRVSGVVAKVVRRMPPNTAMGHEEDETEPVYELDDGSLAAHGALEAEADSAPHSEPEEGVEESAPESQEE